jgi:hypothetical protein
MLRIDWTPEKKDAVAMAIDRWLKKHNAWGGEMIMQDDDCQIEAPVLISDLVDDIIKPEIKEE